MQVRMAQCLAAAAILALSTPAAAQLRSFMLPAGVDPNGVPMGMTSVVLNPGAEQLDLVVWFEDAVGAHPAGLNGYQIIVPWCVNAEGSGQCLMSGDSGEIAYVDINPGMGGGDSIIVDKDNQEWLFANDSIAGLLPVSYNETPPGGVNHPIIGAIFNTLPGSAADPGPGGDVPNPGGPNYIVQYSFDVSADACGTFTLPFNIPPANPPLCAYFDPFGAAYGGFSAVTFMPIQITIGPANDTCNDALELPPAGQSVTYDTTCASVDGPQGCAAGPDIWYALTPAVFTELEVTLSGEGTVATYIGQGCPPAGPPDFCGNVSDVPVFPGIEILIQVIGEDAQGTLFAVGCGCKNDSNCDDGNPCTNDVCNPDCSCSNVPNSLPCEDGDVCTLNDQCSMGACVPGPVNDCNDFNGCTQDLCIAGVGCDNPPIDGEGCTVDDDCNINGVQGATCDAGVCSCVIEPGGVPDSVRLDVRNCDNGPSAVFGDCESEDAECGPAPDGILQCSDDNGEPLDGGICVEQCCYEPGSKLWVDLEIGPMQDGACGGQFFLNYDPSCLTLQDKVIDPDGELGWTFVISNAKDPNGNIDLVVSLPPGIACDDASASFLGGTVARLFFEASGECKCAGIDFRPHNPPTKVTGPKGDIDLSELTGTDQIQIQGAPEIACPEDTEDHADCNSIFRTVVYGPVTVTDTCEEITADITDLCNVEFRKACLSNLDCGRGDLCGPNNTSCGGGFCEVDPLVDGAGFTCNGEPCVGYCTIDTCAAGVCATEREPTFEVDGFLDCSDGCQLPPGEITIVCAYTNGCGRTAECASRHFNSGLNQLCVDLELSPSMLPGDPNDPITRCIDFAISECDAAGFPVCNAPFGDGTQFCSPMDQDACGGHPEACFPAAAGNTITVSKEVVFGLPENIAGHGQACLKIPPGNWTCLTATDPKHSLTSTCTVECTEDNILYAEFKGSKETSETCHWLVQGNLDGNPVIDIADYTILAGEYLSNYGTANTPCKGDNIPENNFHADFNGDGLVTLADWTFVVFNFFCASKDPCNVVCDPAGAAAVAGRRQKPRLSMTRSELEKAGLGEFVDAADANGDGVVNLEDVSLFLDGVDQQGGSKDAEMIRDLKDGVHKAERLQRGRNLLPRTKRTR